MISTVFDTETTGVRTNKDPADPKNSKVLQLYAAVFEHFDDTVFFEEYEDEKGVLRKKFLLKPIQELSVLVCLNDEDTVEPGAQNVHGISKDRAQTLGVMRKSAAGILHDFCDVSDRLVAHNLAFDKKISAHLLHQTKMDVSILDKPQPCCTMTYMRPIMKMLPRVYGDWKNPKLIEAYNYVFGRDFEGAAHDASVDSHACAQIYFDILDKDRKTKE